MSFEDGNTINIAQKKRASKRGEMSMRPRGGRDPVDRKRLIEQANRDPIITRPDEMKAVLESPEGLKIGAALGIVSISATMGVMGIPYVYHHRVDGMSREDALAATWRNMYDLWIVLLTVAPVPLARVAAAVLYKYRDKIQGGSQQEMKNAGKIINDILDSQEMRVFIREAENVAVKGLQNGTISNQDIDRAFITGAEEVTRGMSQKDKETLTNSIVQATGAASTA